MEPTIFQAHPEIIEKVFDALDSNTLLNCRLVCKSWNQFLENPNFWLKKLKEIGQPENIDIAWKSLINKSTNIGIEKCIFAKCLRRKFRHFIAAQQKDEYSIALSFFHLQDCPPLYTASLYGDITVVELIYYFGEDYNCRIYSSVNEIPVEDFVMPLLAAIDNNHSDVAKFIANTSRELENPSVDKQRLSPIAAAIAMSNLELVKYLVPRTPNLNHTNNHGNSLIHLAIMDYNIFQYLISLPGINPNLLNWDNRTPLQLLCSGRYTKGLELPYHHIIEMVKILAPLTDTKHALGKQDYPLNLAATYGQNEVLKILVKYFDANIIDSEGYLPIDYAVLYNDVEAVRILAPLTKNLKIHKRIDFDKYDERISNALNVLQYFIAKRDGIFVKSSSK